MGKSKAQRKQEKKATMQETKAAKVTTEETEKPKASKEPEVKKVAQPEQIKLTMYTLVYMVVTFLSAGIAAFAMAIYGNPAKYLISSYVGEGLNELSREMLRLYLNDDLGEHKMNGLYLGVALILAVGAVAMLIGMIRAVDDSKKPLISLNIIGVIASVAALVLFLYSDGYIKDGIKRYEIDRQPEFGIYNLYLPFLIVYIVVMICNLCSTLGGLKRWKNTGKTSK